MAAGTVVAIDTVSRENRIAAGITARLNEVIPKGSAAEIGRRAGVPYPSLREYLSGSQPRPAVLVALARAAEVRLEWLMTGEGPMREDQQLAAPPAPAPANPGMAEVSAPSGQGLGLTWQVDPDRLARAYEQALAGFAVPAGHRPDARRLMQVTMLIYDHLTEAETASPPPA